ncbi:hypothetical protein MUG84_07625 [Paenibacillus sp. KQZ6P-2]|uniref:Uncharacterized protein n=1 Tax=Paenibacillus mangrovi TaxID=2931978 RepID=A0A9X1WMH5_9BACL|nr:hypothetical protein [Paenibacillus mangrovi]MCJ8011619.1 hypothetical protein [Paenibacillus mangrovi]
MNLLQFVVFPSGQLLKDRDSKQAARKYEDAFPPVRLVLSAAETFQASAGPEQ